MIQPTRVLLLAKEKTKQLRHSLEPSEKFTCKLDRFLTVYQGYNRLKPKLFPKRMSAMFPSDVVVASEGRPQAAFHPAFGTSASLKRHQQDWSEKYQRSRPGGAGGYAIAGTAREREAESGRLQIVAGTVDGGQIDKRKVYGGSVGRARKPHGRSPRRVVLRAANDSGADQSSDILCSSVFLTYREGLFFNTAKQQPAGTARELNCTDV
uniref:Uncharacterized protein n=1 Tax=Anopheles quadriannulatus TaxID=34691 RepID=A0A182X0S8_ANOQN